MSSEFENDDQLDAMLRQHLKCELDPQLGRARLAFQTHLLATQKPPRKIRPHVVRPRVWMIGVVGMAVAASIGALWAMPSVFPVKATTPTAVTVNDPAKGELATMPVAHVANPGAAVRQWEPVTSVVNSVSENQGVVLIGQNTPARVVREVSTECVQYVCPDRNVRMEIVVPRETTRLIPVETH
jgi:hypothetical protein